MLMDQKHDCINGGEFFCKVFNHWSSWFDRGLTLLLYVVETENMTSQIQSITLKFFRCLQSDA